MHKEQTKTGGERNEMDRAKQKKHELIVLTDEEVRQAYDCQKKNGDWTLYQEREFMENLLQTRFNFLITVYTLFLLPFFQATTRDTKMVILFLGLVIVGIMGLSVYRIYIKFDTIMKMLYKLEEHHVLLILKKVLKKRKFKLFGVNRFIGWVMPGFLFLSIVAMGIMSIVFGFGFDFK
jgi:hypothetical protein